MRPTRNPVLAAMRAARERAAMARAIAMILAAFPGTTVVADREDGAS